MAAAAVTSAAPLLALLEEEDDKLKVHALKQLDAVVPHFWYQISTYIPQVEALCEDTDFDHREGASLLVSKVRGIAALKSGRQSALSRVSVSLKTVPLIRGTPAIVNLLCQ